METKFHGLSQGGGAMLGASYGEPQAILQQPALSAVCSTMDEAVRLANRVSIVVERLCGAVPTAVDQRISKDQGYSSIFDGLRGQADNANRQISEAMFALDRLDRELP